MYTASVEMPDDVRIGGDPERARAWYARKMNPKESTRKRRGTRTSLEELAAKALDV